MATETGDRMKIVVYYAVWATLCAAAAGVVTAFIHTWAFSYIPPSRPALWQTLFGDVVTALSIAAGQGAVALVTGSILTQLGRTLRFTLLMGLVLGLFDFVMFLLQMAVPATELGWVPDILILVGVTAAITALGSAKASAA